MTGESVTEPIEEKFVVQMNAIAKGINHLLNEGAAENKVGFVLLMFEFKESGGGVNYISNAERQDMIAVMKAFIAHSEAA